MNTTASAFRWRLAVLSFFIAFIAVARPVQSEETGRKISIDSLRPGMTCRVKLATAQHSDGHSVSEYVGKIRSVTETNIELITGIREGRNEYITPILGRLPYVGRLFRTVAVGREEITSRIEIAQIDSIEQVSAPSGE